MLAVRVNWPCYVICMKVELEKGVWLTDSGNGDPPQTLDEDLATNYKIMREALDALEEARIYRPFKNAVILDDFLP